MENETGNPFIPHVTDVLNVKSTLWRKKLPVELIDSIVDFAEYWPRVVTSVENTITIGNDGNFLYIQSQPLPGLFVLESSGEGGEREELVVGGIESGTLNPARKIVFRIWSHDQGWSSNPGRGTYNGSHTWFETFAERPLSIQAIQNAAPLPSPTDISDETELRELQSFDGKPIWETVSVSETTKGEDGVENVVTEKKVWHIQRNVHASNTIKEHEIVWTRSDDGEDKSDEEGDLNTGTGKGADLVRCLKPGYRIRVTARALYPGWANSVEKIELEIFYAV